MNTTRAATITAFLVSSFVSCGKQSQQSPTRLVEAGLVTAENASARLIGGPGATGRIGDYYLQNSRVRFVIQAPGRDVGPSPYGGNIVDADYVRPQGEAANDQMGELSLFLNLGRTANFTNVAIVSDGSNGGAAQILATGTDEVNDYINLAGLLGSLSSLLGFNANQDLPVQIQALYTLEPDKPYVRIQYTLLNESQSTLPVSIGAILDSGGNVEVFRPGFGFGQASINDISTLLLTLSGAVPYVAHQGPGVAYGVFPNLPLRGNGTYPQHMVLTVAGVTVTVFDASDLLGAVTTTSFNIGAGASLTYEVVLVVGKPDIAAIDGVVATLRGRETGAVTGRVFDGASDAGLAGVRIAALAQDAAVAVFETTSTGSFGGTLAAGDYLLRAEGIPADAGGEAVVTVSGDAGADVTFIAPQTGLLPYTVVEADGGGIPCRLSFIGADPMPANLSQRDVSSDSPPTGLAFSFRSRYGTSDIEGPLNVKPGTYKLVVSRGNEYSLCTVSPLTIIAGQNQRVSCTLTRVLDTGGYVTADFHQHTLNSPDSPVPLEDRLKGYLAEGLEFFASTDHDVVSDYSPIISALGAGSLIKYVPGVETTPFDYGHFNGYPIPIDTTRPSNGAIDWGTATLFNLLPGEIFAAMRDAGAQVVQVNHPRTTTTNNAIATFQKYFDRAALSFDLTLGVAFGASDGGQPVPNETLRLPMGQPFWSDNFDAMEVYNGYTLPASNPDGLGRDDTVDAILRDWFNFLSVGKIYTIVGVSDSHKLIRDPGSYPRTFVRVTNDNVSSLDTDQVMAGILAHDAIATNGPFVEIWAGPDKSTGGMGRIVAVDGGTIAVHVRAQVPDWMDIAQVDLYVNTTSQRDADGGLTPLTPVASAGVGDGGALSVSSVPVGGAARLEAEVTFNVNLAGPKDAWAVAIVRGRKVLFPVIPEQVTWPSNDYLNGTPSGGVRPLAITNPVFLDVNGNGVYNPPNKP